MTFCLGDGVCGDPVSNFVHIVSIVNWVSSECSDERFDVAFRLDKGQTFLGRFETTHNVQTSGFEFIAGRPKKDLRYGIWRSRREMSFFCFLIKR